MSEAEVIYPKNQHEWRAWLEKNHASKQAVWVVFYSKSSLKPSLTWGESVDVALCYGWIDSKKIKIDHETSHQFFSRRKPKSTWSKINKEKVERLIRKGLMTEAGLKSIEIAKQNGSWSILDEVEELLIPNDLEQAFKAFKESKSYFLRLSKSKRKMLLQWLVLAVRPETRKKRVLEIVTHLSKEELPKQFR